MSAAKFRQRSCGNSSPAILWPKRHKKSRLSIPHPPHGKGITLRTHRSETKPRRPGWRIVQLERQVRARKEGLNHVDACLRLLDPTLLVEDIPNKRTVKHVNLFRQGGLSRLVMETLREANGTPMAPSEIVAAIIAKCGLTSDAHNALRVRVRSNLAYLQRRKQGREAW